MLMLLFLLLPLLALAYVGWHVWLLLPLSWGWRTVILLLMVGAFMLLFASIFRATDRLPMPLATAVYEVGTSSIIVLLYLTMLFFVLDIARLVHLLPAAWLRDNWWTTGGIVLLLFGLFVYGNIHYRHKYREEVTLRSAKVTKPVKLVLMSDLHLGYHNRRKEFARWVDLINNEHPDLVLVAGDIIDGSMRPLRDERMHEEFRRLEAPVFACLGNHEYFSGEPEAQRFYGDAGIHLLRDASAIQGDLCIMGRDDRMNRRRLPLKDLVASADKSKYLILLDHQPYHLEQAEREGIDFQFSGHTHHGQVWPISWITDMMYECAFGTYQRGATNYYVSSGIGIWGGKFRIGTRSEYLVLTIEPLQQGQAGG
jgi:predicted MPP superfamily phosphohydrolase